MTISPEMAQQLLGQMGASSFSEATNIVANINTFVDAAKALTGKASTSEALAAIKALAANGGALEKLLGKSGDAALNELTSLKAFAKGVEDATAAQGPEALGVIAAGKSAIARVGVLESEAKAALKTAEDRDAKESIAVATTEGRLRPAAKEDAEAVYAELGLKGLKRFLSALPVGAPVTGITDPANKQPAPKTEGNASIDADVTARLTAKGYSADEIKAALALPVTIVRDLEKED